MAYKGRFKPTNPSKYMGDPTNIIYRSRWELLFMSYLDKHPHVKQWASEEVIIPYRSPIDGKIHRYYPDFLVKRINKKGIKETILIEIKPEHQTVPPQIQKSKSQKYLNEVKTWGINDAKWKAARNYCEDRGWKFEIFTERHLGLKK